MLRLMTVCDASGNPEPIGIVAAVAGLGIALRTNDFPALADQVEREFNAVVEAAKKIDGFYKARRRPAWIEDYGLSLAPNEIDGATLLNCFLPECKEVIDRFSQTLSWMHAPIVKPAGHKRKTFGSSRGKPGGAGQSKARHTRKHASKKAGAYRSILPTENSDETPAKVRSDHAQVRREDLDPGLLELSEAVRKQLAEIFAKIEELDFQQTRERLICKCREFRQYVEDAQPGHEFDDTLPLQFETYWLARRLGFGVGPVAVTYTHESMVEFRTRMGLRLKLPPGPIADAKADIHLVTAHLPYGGRALTLPIAMYYQCGKELVGVANDPLPDENRRKLLSRFDKWITAAGNCLPSDFRSDVRPAEIDYLNALVIYSAELLLLWHAPKANLPSAPPTDGVLMSETTESLSADETGRPMSIARQIEQFITDVDNWIRPRPGISVDGAAPDSMVRRAREAEISRDNAVKGGNLTAAALVKCGESPRAVLTIVNSLESKDYAQARKDWPAVKVELREAAIRARLKDDTTQAGGGSGEEDPGGKHMPTNKPRRAAHRPPKRSRKDDARLVADWQASGMTKGEFERQRGIGEGEVTKAQDSLRKPRKDSADAE